MIDWNRVRDLRDEMGEEDFPEVVKLFLEEAEEVVERLSDTPEETGKLEQDLHFLKGSAMSFGFIDLSGLCQDGEHKSSTGQAETVDIWEVVKVYYETKTRFLQELSAHLTTSHSPGQLVLLAQPAKTR